MPRHSGRRATFARVRSRLTFANVVSSIALFIALGGSSYAITLGRNSVKARQIAKDAVGSSEIKRSAVGSSEVRNGALLAADFKSGQLSKGAKGDKGDTGASGAAGAAGAAGTARAYGLVSAVGALDAAKSKNVAAVNHTANTGIYCIVLAAGIDPASTEAVVTIDSASGAGTTTAVNNNDDKAFADIRSTRTECSTTGQLEVRTGLQLFTTGALVGNSLFDEGFFFVVP